jgi:hypothetical protein
MAKLILADESIQYEIGTEYLSAIINGDNSALTDDEDQQLDAFLNRVGHGVWTVLDESEHWAHCEVSGVFGDCSLLDFTPYIDGGAA